MSTFAVVYRVAVVIVIALLTTCMTCSCLFPLYRRAHSDFLGRRFRWTYYFFYSETSTALAGDYWTVVRKDARDFYCEPMRHIYNAASGLAVAAAAMGGAATLLGVAWVTVNKAAVLGSLIFALTALSFICALVVAALMGHAYNTNYCSDDKYVTVLSPNGTGFNIAAGYYLLCVATIGFFVMTVIQVVGLVFGWQMRITTKAEEEKKPQQQQEAVSKAKGFVVVTGPADAGAMREAAMVRAEAGVEAMTSANPLSTSTDTSDRDSLSLHKP